MEAQMREFMVKYGQHRQDQPGNIPDEVKVLRMRLMMEELGETVAAMHKNDLVEVADGLTDLLYVTVGTMVAYGMPVQELYDEVHRSNMTKAPLDSSNKGGKVTKEGYSPANIRWVLERFGWQDPAISEADRERAEHIPDR